MTGNPTIVLFVAEATYNRDAAEAPQDGAGRVFRVKGHRRDLAGRRDSAGNILTDEVVTMWRFPKAGLEDMTARWKIWTEDAHGTTDYVIEALLEDRQYPLRYWEARCLNPRASRSRRP